MSDVDLQEPEDGRRPESDEPSSQNTELAGRQTDRNRVVHWLFVSGDRLLLVALLSAGASALYFGLGQAGVIGVTSGSLVASAFTSGITGVFTIVAVTISINQLVLSRVIGSPESIRTRMDSVRTFREDVEDMESEDIVSPTMPAGFLMLLLGILRERAVTLDRTFRDEHDERWQREVRDLRHTLENLHDQVENDLPHDQLRLFEVLLPVLTNEFSQHLHTTRTIEASVADPTPEEQAAFDDLVEALEEVNLTRHYFKTLYVHEELATVSRLILLTGLPAVLVSMGVLLVYSADSIFLAESALTIVVSAGFGVVLLPLNVLFAYGLRVGAIARMTTTFGTFTPVDEMP